MLTVDGYDLTALGLTIQTVDGLGGLGVDVPTAPVPGRIAHYRLGSPRERERQITVNATVSVSSLDELPTLRARIDEIHWRLARESVEISFPDQPTRYYVATLTNPDELRIPPHFHQRARQLRLLFLCPDPLAYATSETTVAFTAAAAQTALGNAPVWPVITVSAPPATFDIVYRDYAGVEQGRLGFDGVSGELVVDMDTQVITEDGTAAPELVVGGDFFRLDPVHAASLSGAWPTLELSVAGSAEAVYRKAWRS